MQQANTAAAARQREERCRMTVYRPAGVTPAPTGAARGGRAGALLPPGATRLHAFMSASLNISATSVNECRRVRQDCRESTGPIQARVSMQPMLKLRSSSDSARNARQREPRLPSTSMPATAARLCVEGKVRLLVGEFFSDVHPSACRPGSVAVAEPLNRITADAGQALRDRGDPGYR